MPLQDKFVSETPSVLTVQFQTADNNQAALNAALAESNGVVASSVTLQSVGLNGGLGGTPVPQSAAAAAQGTVGDALSGAGSTPLTPPCFTYDTWVLLYDGSRKQIGDIKVGRDSVLAFDKDGNVSAAKVIGKWEHLVPEYLEISFRNGQKTKVTSNHRYWVADTTFAPIGETPVVKQWDGREWETVQVVARRVIRPFQGVFVYNLTVETFHTYFANGHAVSNLKPEPPEGPLEY